MYYICGVNNKLFIGNKATKQYKCVGVSVGLGWKDIDTQELIRFISEAELSETDVGGKTNLVFFTEYDDLHEVFLQNGEYVKDGDAISFEWPTD